MTFLLLSGLGSGLYIASLLLSRPLSFAVSAVGGFVCFVADVLNGSTGWAAFQGSLTVLFAWLWWSNGGGRRMKQAARELGAKSRARVDALVEQLSPSPIPVPVNANYRDAR